MQIEKKKGRHVQWDQDKLKETQKTRGMFKKIDEPKTPYHRNSDSDEEEMRPQAKEEDELILEANLAKAKRNSESNAHKKINLSQLNARLQEELKHSRQEGAMEDEDQQAQRKKREEFKKKRASHYNQFKAIQQIRHNKWEEDD